jgi:hypothetical protein
MSKRSILLNTSNMAMDRTVEVMSENVQEDEHVVCRLVFST